MSFQNSYKFSVVQWLQNKSWRPDVFQDNTYWLAFKKDPGFDYNNSHIHYFV